MTKTESKPNAGNLFDHCPTPAEGEAFEELLRCRNLRIERILSSDHPDSGCYDQAQDEWVCLLRGEATLWIADETARGETVRLVAGGYRFIPAHTSHRVIETSSEPSCLWLAVHLHPEPPAA